MARFAPLVVALSLVQLAATAAPSNDPEVAQLAGQLEAVRELRFIRPVPSQRLPAVKALPWVVTLLEKEQSPQELAQQQRLLIALGLLPAGYELRARLHELLQEQVAGFYDPYRKQLVVVDFPADHPLYDSMALARAPILVHELDHALTDQHFDVQRLVAPSALRGRDDLLLARRALAEGDATLVMLLFALKQAGVEPTAETVSEELIHTQVATIRSGSTPLLAKAPPFLRAQLVEPYALGLELCYRAWRTGGWRAVDALWRAPPASTEQLLHVERRGDVPASPAPRSRPGEKSTTVIESELGELGTRLWLELSLPTADAASAAAGWDGDRVEWHVGNATGVRSRIVWRSNWDDESEAEQFAVAARQVCPKLPSRPTDCKVVRTGSSIQIEWTP